MGFTPDREELAWAAGFFDGEGCVGVIRPGAKFRRVPFANIRITQVDRRVLDRFAAAVGMGRVYGPTKGYGRSQPQHRYHASQHPAVQAICAMLWMWLSPVKRDQFRRALKTATDALVRHLCEHGAQRSHCETCQRVRGLTRSRRHSLKRKTAVAMLAA